MLKAHPRGHRAEKKQTTKAAIREAYLNGPKRQVQIIPAAHELNTETEKKKLRVCAHCRVSTDEDAQAGSYELQVQHDTQLIQKMKIGSLQASMRMRAFPPLPLYIGRNSSK